VRVRDRKGMWEERGGGKRRRQEKMGWRKGKACGCGGIRGDRRDRKGLGLTIKAFLYNKKFWFCTI
jgi:hypothetical protein